MLCEQNDGVEQKVQKPEAVCLLPVKVMTASTEVSARLTASHAALYHTPGDAVCVVYVSYLSLRMQDGFMVKFLLNDATFSCY